MTADFPAALPLIQPLSLLGGSGMICTDDYCVVPGAAGAEDAASVDPVGVPLSR